MPKSIKKLVQNSTKSTARRGASNLSGRAAQPKKPIHHKVAHHTKRLLVPHKSNNYRPHLIRVPGLVAVLLLSIAMLGGYNLATFGKFQVLGYASNVSVSDLAAQTNKVRQEAGLPALELNSALNRAAYAKAQDMLQADYWAHVSPSGVSPWKWLADQNYNYNHAGENLAKNYPTAKATVDAWMASPSHRDNILKPEYEDVGFAVVEGELNGKDTTLVVAYYGQSVESAVAGSAFTAPSTGTTPVSYFASLASAINPATWTVLALLALVGVVALFAQLFRKQLPSSWRKSWKLHHGAYTTVGVLLVMVMLVFSTTVGQI